MKPSVYLRHWWQLRNCEIAFLLRALVVIAVASVAVGALDFADQRDMEAMRQEAAAQRAERTLLNCLNDQLILHTATVGVRCKPQEVRL